MAAGTSVQPVDDVAFEDRTIRKAFRYVMTFLFVMTVVARLDRNNIGFAALSMNKELALTAMMFGFASTVSYVTYVVFEIPSNICLRRYGARIWIARIAISWGIASAATMFAVGARSLYVFRGLVGLFEAGFTPGVLLYLTYFFPATFRARATSIFALAQPVTLVVAATLSGVIMDNLHGVLGLSGWRWLFLLEGLPAVVLGVATYFVLSDGPKGARWLDEREKAAIARRLEREEKAAPPHASSGKTWRDVLSLYVILLAATYFCLVSSLETISTWTPQIVRDLLKTHSSFSSIGVWSAFPSVVAAVALVLWSRHSDKKMERTWHYSGAVLLACLGWVMVALCKQPELRMTGMVFATVGTYCGFTIFWTIPGHVVSDMARAVGIAFISMCGTSSSAVGPVIFGFLRDRTHSWASSVLYVATLLLISSCLIFLIPLKSKLKASAQQASLMSATETNPT